MLKRKSPIQWRVFTSAPFGIALALLLANDFVLKYAYANAVTGKLSDVAGLFVLASFLCAFFPRHVAACCAVAAAVLIAWKSPLADPVIDLLNGMMPFTFARVPDYTDLLAVLVLPFVGVCFRRTGAMQWPLPSPQLAAVPIAALTIFAMAGTTAVHRVDDLKIGLGKPAETASRTDEDIAAVVDEFLVTRGFERSDDGRTYGRDVVRDNGSKYHLGVGVHASATEVRIRVSTGASGLNSPGAPARKIRRELKEHLESKFPEIRFGR